MAASFDSIFARTTRLAAALAVAAASPSWGQPTLVFAESGAGATGVRVTGFGDGLYVDQANRDGLHVEQATFTGVFVNRATYDGMRVDTAGVSGGGATYSLLNDGYEIADAQGRGLFVGHAGFEGVSVYRSLGDGIKVYTAGTPAGAPLSSPSPNGLEIENTQGHGIFVGRSDGDGVRVQEGGINGGYFRSVVNNGNGIYAEANNGTVAYAVWGASSAGYAGFFSGRVQVNGDLSVFGTLTKSAGSFKIDHPLDPENKYLSHAFVESPDMKNIYDGVAVLDARGEAEVELPEWFEALNTDFRYQLTTIGGYAPVYIAREIEGNRFLIAGGTPELKVSWQVTGSRQDAYALHNPIPVEEWKAPEDQGRYLYPSGYGETEDLAIGPGLGKPDPNYPLVYVPRAEDSFTSSKPPARHQ